MTAEPGSGVLVLEADGEGAVAVGRGAVIGPVSPRAAACRASEAETEASSAASAGEAASRSVSLAPAACRSMAASAATEEGGALFVGLAVAEALALGDAVGRPVARAARWATRSARSGFSLSAWAAPGPARSAS